MSNLIWAGSILEFVIGTILRHGYAIPGAASQLREPAGVEEPGQLNGPAGGDRSGLLGGPAGGDEPGQRKAQVADIGQASSEDQLAEMGQVSSRASWRGDRPGQLKCCGEFPATLPSAQDGISREVG